MMLALLHALGQGVPKNFVKAAYWYRKAAAHGYAGAENNLGLLYATGRGVAQNDTTAIAWWQKAAAQGYVIAEANLGMFYVLGRGVPQDYISGLKWLILAKESGLRSAAKAIREVEHIATTAQVARAKTLANEWWMTHHDKH